MKHIALGRVLWLTVLALFAQPLYAHTTGHAFSGFGSGLAHPLLGADHLLAMLAVGVWAAHLRGRAVWLLPSTFVAALLIGLQLGLGSGAVPLIEPMMATSLLVLGLLIALQLRFAPSAAMTIVAAFGLVHGHAHGIEMVGALVPYAAGMSLASALLHGAGIGLGLLLQGARSKLYRFSGAAVAVAGAALLLV
jgi:urease accessory protein